ncbi:MlaD family protein [Dokdonella fugitiva]|jgi:phospholipid/cholesterol/gamma-HCH transport system substrate-binding protein|uniref:Phospholipid/cholesterol/gamma-HCH transport system substrate-binding protein n=1 Tax=Dokdonella fugitiva TaxID=328517 RepID=A0A4R2IFZ2_9GAMM|nr:MlaD family protein [Dokdonella fugitiva]MBA8882452.1 phospholipid/cholesterol/gamma-HCH transport system substrate-binding protein [Dokdonella fugitiva]TCO42749.1 phospholipid/cholesterol/gamma-HCH transport system substrate-binding protein [Dokdonella fugitiva]
MKRDTINYTLVGAVVVGAIALLLVALALITGKGVASTDYVVRYRNVTGLRYGAPVFYEGYRIGQVGAVTPERTAEGTRYKVVLAIRRDWPIPVDSPARLQSSGLLADVSIGIHEGTSKDKLAPGGELKGIEGADIFAAMNELAGQISDLTRTQISPLIATLSQRVDSITGTIDKTTPVILEQTRALLERANHASDSINDLLRPENRAAVGAILGEVKNLGAELRKTRATLDGALDELAGIARDNRPDVRSAVQDLASVLGALSARMDVITHHLESSSRNLDEFSREIRSHPNRLILAPKADKLQEEPQ